VLTARGEAAYRPCFRKHAVAIRKVFSELSSEQRKQLEKNLKQAGRNAAALGLAEERKV
jgi:DNA-binding MarR family transcriptional regulator